MGERVRYFERVAYNISIRVCIIIHAYTTLDSVVKEVVFLGTTFHVVSHLVYVSS